MTPKFIPWARRGYSKQAALAAETAFAYRIYTFSVALVETQVAAQLNAGIQQGFSSACPQQTKIPQINHKTVLAAHTSVEPEALINPKALSKLSGVTRKKLRP